MKLIDAIEESAMKYIALQKREWMPGLIAIIRAVDKGDDVALLTARSNKSENKAIVRGIEKMIQRLSDNKSFSFNPGNIHFVSDLGYVGSDTSIKKANVLKSYEQAYDSVKFYDDEKKNIDAARHVIKKSLNIKEWDAEKLQDPGEKIKKTIHVFDIDGTIINSPAKIYITKDNKRIKSMTQEEFAELKDYSLKDGESWDFQDFSNKDLIEKYMKNYKVFKK